MPAKKRGDPKKGKPRPKKKRPPVFSVLEHNFLSAYARSGQAIWESDRLQMPPYWGSSVLNRKGALEIVKRYQEKIFEKAAAEQTVILMRDQSYAQEKLMQITDTLIGAIGSDLKGAIGACSALQKHGEVIAKICGFIVETPRVAVSANAQSGLTLGATAEETTRHKLLQDGVFRSTWMVEKQQELVERVLAKEPGIIEGEVK